VPVDATEREDVLDTFRSRDDEQPPLVCPARGARVEQHMDAARVEERQAYEVEDELGSAGRARSRPRPGRGLRLRDPVRGRRARPSVAHGIRAWLRIPAAGRRVTTTQWPCSRSRTTRAPARDIEGVTRCTGTMPATSSQLRGRPERVGCGDLKVPRRCRRMPNGADRCRRLRTPRARPMRAFWLCAGHLRASPDCHGKEGVAGSSPAEGSRKPRDSAVFSFPERRGGPLPNGSGREEVKHGRCPAPRRRWLGRAKPAGLGPRYRRGTRPAPMSVVTPCERSPNGSTPISAAALASRRARSRLVCELGLSPLARGGIGPGPDRGAA
jgi:hypothetical protein